MEHVDAILIDELLKNGADVVIATLTKMDLVRLFKEKFDIKLCKSPKIYSLFPPCITALPICQPFWNWFSMLNCIRSEKPDMIYIDGYYYRISKYLKRNAQVFVYDNEPVAVDERGEVKLDKNSPPYVRIYTKFFDRLLKSVTDRESADKVICNSDYSAKLYKNAFKTLPEVVLPPVCITKFSAGSKENLISCVGNFTPRKRFEKTIRAVALSKTKPKLAIVGSVPTGGDIYLSYLRRLCKQLQIEENVTFYPNSSFEQLRQIISKSRICVSNGIEYFGVALVEQMAAGCIPIVYKGTAPWEDIIAKGKFGFGFETSVDLADTIDRIMSDVELQKRMSNISRIRAQKFDESVFREKMVALLL